MSHLVQLLFKKNETQQLRVTLVSTSQKFLAVNEFFTNDSPSVLFHITHSNHLSQFDISGLHLYTCLTFEKRGSNFEFQRVFDCETCLAENFNLLTLDKVVLFLPTSLLNGLEQLRGLYIFYSNNTLHWPIKIRDKYDFKIPECHQNNYNLSALAPLAIKKVSINEFYSISNDLPLFVKIPQKTYPDDSFLHLMAKRETIRFAVLQKSYLSGYLHGISIYEISPKITIPNLIHQENEVYI